jgi:hypothetical protein
LDGIVREIVWVLPGVEGKVTAKPDIFYELFPDGESQKGIILGATPLVECSIKNMPDLKEPVLLIVDADSLDQAIFSRFIQRWQEKGLVSDLMIVSSRRQSDQTRQWVDKLRRMQTDEK